MLTPERLLVVVDPSQSEHIALQRAILTSTFRDPKPIVSVLVTVDQESVDTRATNDNIFRHQSWFRENIKTPLEEAGIEYQVEISWSTEWQKGILNLARQFGADSIFIPVKAKTNRHRFTFSDSKWELLKGASCPVVLIRPGAKEQRKNILAAVNFQATSDIQRELNNKILAQGRRMAEGYGAKFCVANAYLDSMNYPDRGKLAKETGLSAENIYVKNGYTDEVVSTVAKEIDADLVVIGTLGANGMLKSRRGYTAERLIGALDDDVMIINHE